MCRTQVCREFSAKREGWPENLGTMISHLGVQEA
jgi:hypothetical protein